MDIVTLQQGIAYNDYLKEDTELDFWLYYRYWCSERGLFYDA